VESEMQIESSSNNFSDHFISFLGGLVVGSVAWAAGFALVTFIKASAPPGLNLLETLTSMKLVPPPGIDLSNINIVIPLPGSPAINIAFVVVPLLFGAVVALISYKRILNLD